jgi:hypothetical protein
VWGFFVVADHNACSSGAMTQSMRATLPTICLDSFSLRQLSLSIDSSVLPQGGRNGYRYYSQRQQFLHPCVFLPFCGTSQRVRLFCFPPRVLGSTFAEVVSCSSSVLYMLEGCSHHLVCYCFMHTTTDKWREENATRRANTYVCT